MANDSTIRPELTIEDFGPEPDAPYCFACEEEGHESDEDERCLKEYEEQDPCTLAKESGL